jgi:hypothetical protein
MVDSECVNGRGVGLGSGRYRGRLVENSALTVSITMMGNALMLWADESASSERIGLQTHAIRTVAAFKAVIAQHVIQRERLGMAHAILPRAQ